MELTENAAAALEHIRQSEEIPEEHGTRLTADEQPSGDLAVRLEFVEQVPEGDQVAEQAGTEIYVDPNRATRRDDHGRAGQPGRSRLRVPGADSLSAEGR